MCRHLGYLGPHAAVVVTAVVDKREVGAVGDGHNVDAEGREVDLVGRALVVVGPRLEVGAHDEGPALDEHIVGTHRRRGRTRLVGMRIAVVA